MFWISLVGKAVSSLTPYSLARHPRFSRHVCSGFYEVFYRASGLVHYYLSNPSDNQVVTFSRNYNSAGIFEGGFTLHTTTGAIAYYSPFINEMGELRLIRSFTSSLSLKGLAASFRLQTTPLLRARYQNLHQFKTLVYSPKVAAPVPFSD